MKKLLIFFKNNLGELSTIIGSGILSYNIFNFSRGSREALRLSLDLGSPADDYYYYYSVETLWFIAVGIMLIVLGLLILRNKN